MNDREVLLKRVQICDFILQDTALFLDSHPDDPAALEYYNRYADLHKKATADYVMRYGPVSRGDFAGGRRWTWVDGPWPWQNEEA